MVIWSQRTFYFQNFITSAPLFILSSDLLEVEAVRDVVSGHEGSQQVCDGAGLSTVRPEQERVHSPLSGEQHRKEMGVGNAAGR